MLVMKYWEPGEGFDHVIIEQLRDEKVWYIGPKVLCEVRRNKWAKHTKLLFCNSIHSIKETIDSWWLEQFNCLVIEGVQFNFNKTRVAQNISKIIAKFAENESNLIIVRIDEREQLECGFETYEDFRKFYSVFDKPMPQPYDEASALKVKKPETEGMRSKFIPQIVYKSVGKQEVWCYEFIDVTFIDDFGSEGKGYKCKKLVFNFIEGVCGVYHSLDGRKIKEMNLFVLGGGTASYMYHKELVENAIKAKE